MPCGRRCRSATHSAPLREGRRRRIGGRPGVAWRLPGSFITAFAEDADGRPTAGRSPDPDRGEGLEGNRARAGDPLSDGGEPPHGHRREAGPVGKPRPDQVRRRAARPADLSRLPTRAFAHVPAHGARGRDRRHRLAPRRCRGLRGQAQPAGAAEAACSLAGQDPPALARKAETRAGAPPPTSTRRPEPASAAVAR